MCKESADPSGTDNWAALGVGFFVVSILAETAQHASLHCSLAPARPFRLSVFHMLLMFSNVLKFSVAAGGYLKGSLEGAIYRSVPWRRGGSGLISPKRGSRPARSV